MGRAGRPTTSLPRTMSPDELRTLPKVLLHDHLDGGLRPLTILELAEIDGYDGLPSRDLDELTDWFFQGQSASLERYLEAFTHTVGVMQTAEGIERVSYEATEDLAAQGVVYAEMRMAPSLCTERDLDRTEAIGAMLAGMSRGEAEFGVPVRLIVDAMRQESDSIEVARSAVEFAGQGVVGFDLAGPEAGFSAIDHRAACEIAVEGGLHLTIHAGEGDGVQSIVGAVEVGAERLGHAVRLVEDIRVVAGEAEKLGPVAQSILDAGLTLEVCPTSNLHTGLFPDARSHPLGLLHRAGFAVTINTDNRLMSRITPTDEFSFAVEHQGFDLQDLELVTMRAIDAAFCDQATKDRVTATVMAGYSD